MPCPASTADEAVLPPAFSVPGALRLRSLLRSELCSARLIEIFLSGSETQKLSPTYRKKHLIRLCSLL
jgi:hypothetical protein